MPDKARIEAAAPGRLSKVKVRKLNYGRFNWYDALAPEFKTYKTIRELTQEKTKGM